MRNAPNADMKRMLHTSCSLRRRFLRVAGAGVACIAAPALSGAAIPFPIRPKIQRKSNTLIVGYFGDSTTRGAWAANNPLPYPNNYSYLSLTSIIQAALSDFSPVEVFQKGENALSGTVLLNGGYIPTIEGIRVSPFATLLTEYAYDAVIVGVGICDALTGQTPEQFQNTLAGLYSAAHSAGIAIVFETPNPIPLSVAYPEVEAYRPYYRAYDMVVDQNYTMEMSDEFHPTPAAYVVKATRLAQFLRDSMIQRFRMVGA